MQQQTMFDVPEKLNFKGLVRSLSFEQQEIIKGIMRLYNSDRPFDLDVTYSKGVFWKGLPKPRYKFDAMPQVSGTIPARAENIPLANESISSIMFDPPFVVAPSPRPGIIRDRFSCYRNIDELWQFYKESLYELYRVLKPSGIIVFKCQDIVSGGTQHMSHYSVMKYADEIGFYTKDFFVLGNRNVLWSPNMINQQHARKNHSYFIVFQKTLCHSN